MALVTAVQAGVSSLLLNWLKGDFATVSEKQKFASVALGGGVSGLVASPFELLMDRYRETVKAAQAANRSLPSYASVIKNVLAKEGFAVVKLGMAYTVVRDSGFTVTYRVAAPALKERLTPAFGEF
jgi:hypothetical protein